MKNFKNTSNSLIQVNTDFILLWNKRRQQKKEVQKIFNDQGNIFNFVKPDNTIKSIHIYIACDERKSLYCYFISSIDDAEKKFNWIYKSEIPSIKESLPEKNLPPKGSNEYLDWETANQWVNNWINVNKRNDWIHEQFNANISKNNIVLAFEINVDDFTVNDIHNCFLGLKKDYNDEYQIDLIVYNTSTNRVLNYNIHKYDSVHDLARPVPPFGGGLNYGDFGVLDSLGIQ